MNARSQDGGTPLHGAVRNENPAVTEALLAAGADVNARMSNGFYGLIPGAPTIHLVTGAELNGRSQDGVTPLHLAAGYNQNPAVTEALLAAGADVNARSISGLTPLHRAAGVNENPAVIGLLLEAGANLEARDENGGLTPPVSGGGVQ